MFVNFDSMRDAVEQAIARNELEWYFYQMKLKSWHDPLPLGHGVCVAPLKLLVENMTLEEFFDVPVVNLTK